MSKRSEEGTMLPEDWTTELPEMDWEEIDRPGCYLHMDTGVLFRIPKDGLGTGHLPAIQLVCRAGTRVARVSDSPAEPLETLRVLATSKGYLAAF